jgi:hypothetical protein
MFVLRDNSFFIFNNSLFLRADAARRPINIFSLGAICKVEGEQFGREKKSTTTGSFWPVGRQLTPRHAGTHPDFLFYFFLRAEIYGVLSSGCKLFLLFSLNIIYRFCRDSFGFNYHSGSSKPISFFLVRCGDIHFAKKWRNNFRK